MNATKDYLDLLSTALTQKMKITVREGGLWRANYKDGILEYDKRDLLYLPIGVVRGFLIHETGHLKFSGEYDIGAYAQKYGHAYHDVINAFEDMRIEYRLINEYGDFAYRSLESVNYYMGLREIKTAGMEEYRQLLFKFLDTYYRRKYDSIGRLPELTYSSKVEKFFKDEYYWIRNVVDDCHKQSTTKSMQEYIDQYVMPKIKDFFDEQDPSQDSPNKQQGNSDNSGNGNSENSEDAPVDNTDGKSPDSGQSGEQKPQKKMPGEGSVHRVKTPGRYSGLNGNGGEKIPMPELTEAEAKLAVRPYALTLAQRLRGVLADKQAVHWRGAHKSGKLLSKNTYKAGLNEIRIFSKQTTPDSPYYTIHIVLDSSGSMEGERARSAIMGAHLLNETAKQLRFQIKFWSFDYDCRSMCKLSDYSATGGNTYDYKVFEELLKVISPQENNIVMVLTDGDVCEDSSRDDLLRKLTAQASVYGIGIGDERVSKSLKSNYPNAVFCSQLEDLPKELIAIMRREIHR